MHLCVSLWTRHIFLTELQISPHAVFHCFSTTTIVLLVLLVVLVAKALRSHMYVEIEISNSFNALCPEQ